MKKYVQNILTFLLVFTVIVGTVSPTSAAEKTNDVQDALDKIYVEFPDLTYFTTDGEADSPRYLHSILKAKGKSASGVTNATTCVAFAKYVWLELFGHDITEPYRTQIASGRVGVASTWENAKVGDLIYFYNHSDCNTHPGCTAHKNCSYVHAGIVWAMSDTGVTIYDNNSWGNNKVRLYTANFGEGGWPKSYCRIFRSNNYDEVYKTNTTPLTIISTEDGSWSITIPANYKMLCYASADTAQSTDYRKPRGAAYSLNCTQKAILSDGSIRYYYLPNGLWFDFNSQMSVTEAKEAPTPPSPEPQKPTPSVEAGAWTVTIPANYKVLCYASADAVQSTDYRKPREAAYILNCTQKATLSDGSVRYYYLPNGLWFDFNSQMSVTETKNVPTTPSPAMSTYTVSFDGNGGNVSKKSITVTNGKTYGTLPTPTMTNGVFQGWYTAKSGGTKITSDTKVTLSGNQTLYARWKIWGSWSKWSDKPVSASATRQVETQQVEVKGQTEYRYGRYVSNGHDCWCATYLKTLGYGTGKVNYSAWSATQYSPNGKGWTCGACKGDHSTSDTVDKNGNAVWGEYVISGKSYYWEETRTSASTYKTQYRYRDLK